MILYFDEKSKSSQRYKSQATGDTSVSCHCERQRSNLLHLPV